MEEHPDEQKSIQSSASSAAANGLEEHPHEQNSIQSSAAAAANGSSSDDEAAIDVNSWPWPPGHRFTPTDEEMIEYLRMKINNEPLPFNEIPEVDLYSKHPSKLTAEHKPITEETWYFYTPRAKKYLNGTRPNRATPGDGYWKPTGNDKPITDHPCGHKRTLDFLQGKHPDGIKTCWTMHEYTIQSKNNNPRKRPKNNISPNKARANGDMTLDTWVLCRIYKKKEKRNGDEASTSGVPSHPGIVNESQNNDAACLTDVRNKNIRFEDETRNAFQPTHNVSKSSTEASLLAGNRRIMFQNHTGNAFQPTVNVSQSSTEASLMAGNSRIRFQNQNGNAFQPTVNVSQTSIGASLMSSTGFRYQTQIATRPTVSVPHNIEVSSMAGNYNIGVGYRGWNATWPTISVPQNTEASLMAGNHNIGYQDQTWNGHQPTVNALDNIEGSFMTGNYYNIDSEDEAWLKPNVFSLQNTEASLMAGNSYDEFGHQRWSAFQPIVDESQNNLNVSQPTTNQGAVHEEAGTSQSWFTSTSPTLPTEDDNDIWMHLLPPLDGQTPSKGI